MQLQPLLQLIQFSAAIKKFLEDGSLIVALAQIGGVEVDAAILCLRNKENSTDQRRGIQLAIGHLQSAHIAFERLFRQYTGIAAGFRHQDRIEAIARIQRVNFLMPVCYCYLREPILMRERLAAARAVLEWHDWQWAEADSPSHHFAGLLSFVGEFTNPGNVGAYNHTGRMRRIEREDVDRVTVLLEQCLISA